MGHRIFSLLMGLLAGTAAFVYFIYFKNKNKHVQWEGAFIVQTASNTDPATKRRVFSILKERLAQSGHDFSVKQRNEEQVEFTVRNIRDSQFITPLLTAPGKLQIRASYLNSELSAFIARAVEIRKATIAKEKNGHTADDKEMKGNASELIRELDKGEMMTKEEKDTFDPLLNFLSVDPYNQSIFGWISSKDTQALRLLLNSPELKGTTYSEPLFLYGTRSWKLSKDEPDKRIAVYAIKSAETLNSIVLDNDDLMRAEKDYNYDGREVVSIIFSRYGAHKWEELTAENAQKPIAMIIDGEVFSAPIVEGKLSGNRSIISGNFSPEGIVTIAAILSQPPLPLPVRITESTFKENRTLLSAWQWGLIILIVLTVSGLLYLLLINFRKH